MNKYMPFLSIFSFFSFFTYAVAAIKWPRFVLESFEGWPFEERGQSPWPRIRWPQRIWGLCAFAGLVVMIIFVVHGMWNWIPDPVESSDDSDDSSNGKDLWIGLLSLIGSFGGMWMLVEFARLRLENGPLRFMVSKMSGAMSGGAWKRDSIFKDIKKDFSDKPSPFGFVFNVYTMYTAKDQVLNSIENLNEIIKEETKVISARSIKETCEKERCSRWAKQQEKDRLDEIENERFMEKMEIKIEDNHADDSHEYLTEQIVKEIIFEKLGVKAKQIKNKASLADDLGADDEEIDDLIKALEEQFVLTIPPKETVKFKTIGDIVKYLQIHGDKIDLSEEASIKLAEESEMMHRLIILQKAIEESCSIKLLPEDITKNRNVEGLSTFLRDKTGLKVLPKNISDLVEEFIYLDQTLAEEMKRNSKNIYPDQDP